MRVINLTQENIQPFVQLAPLELIDELADAFHFGLGAVAETEDGTVAAVGILLYDVAEEEYWSSDTGNEVWLRWLYVAQDYRQQGIADGLMETFAELLNESGVSSVACEAPAFADADLLCEFLEQWGFTFSYQKKYELTMTLEELLAYPFFEETPDVNDVKPIRVLSGLQLRKKLEQLAVRNERLRGLLDPEEWEWIAPNISCAVDRGGQLRSIFLVRQRVSGVLEPVFLYGNRENKKEVLAMLRFAAVQAYLNAPMDTPVRLSCRSEAAARLIGWLFADQEPLVVRYGEAAAMPEKIRKLWDIDRQLLALEQSEEQLAWERLIAQAEDYEDEGE